MTTRILLCPPPCNGCPSVVIGPNGLKFIEEEHEELNLNDAQFATAIDEWSKERVTTREGRILLHSVMSRIEHRLDAETRKVLSATPPCSNR